MTTVKLNVSDKDICFECVNHADDHDACTIYSTLCNVLVSACIPYGIMPKVYEPGHVIIVVHEYTEKVLAVFQAVYRTFEETKETYKNICLIRVSDMV